MSLRAVLFDVDFTLAKPGPELMPEGYVRCGERHGLSLEAYRYEEVRISVSGTNPPSNGTQDENETYGLHMWVPTQVPSNGSFTIHTYLVDQVQNYFEYNVTVRAVRDAARTVMVFTFPDEKDNPNLEIRRNAQGEDFRWVVPQRGKLP